MVKRKHHEFVIRRLLYSVISFIKRGLQKTVSIVVVPDNTRKAKQFLVHIPSLIIILFLFCAITVFGSVASIKYFEMKKLYTREQAQTFAVSKKIDELQKAVDSFLLVIDTNSFEIDASLLTTTSTPITANITKEAILEKDYIKKLAMVGSVLQQDAHTVVQLNNFFRVTKPFLFDIPSLWPIKDGKGVISFMYGPNKSPFTGKDYIHSGVDITTGYAGCQIVAAANGVVGEAGYVEDLGNYIIIEHGYGFFTVYGHLQSLNVYTGQQVTRGQTIGRMGNTGLSTGSHLHYEVYRRRQIQDPGPYLAIGRRTFETADIYKRDTGESVGGSGY